MCARVCVCVLYVVVAGSLLVDLGFRVAGVFGDEMVVLVVVIWGCGLSCVV